MKAAFVIFDRMTYLDFIGFYDPVTRLKSMKIIGDFEWRVCSNKQRVADDRGASGLAMIPDSVLEPLDGYDLLFVPGGIGTRTLQSNGRPGRRKGAPTWDVNAAPDSTSATGSGTSTKSSEVIDFAKAVEKVTSKKRKSIS